MKERLKSARSDKSQEEIQQSRYESPKKIPSNHPNNEDHLSDDIQYQLEKVFEQAGNRQSAYINLIKDQESKLKEQSEKYLQTLRQIKNDFMHFITQKQQSKNSPWLRISEQNVKKNQTSFQKLNSNQFTINTKNNIAKDTLNSSSRMQPELHCKINCYYFTPFVKDYIRQEIPQNFILKIRTIYPNMLVTSDLRIIKEEDEVDNINYLLNRVPFQIATPQDESIIVSFKIPCQHDIINYYKRRQFQLELVNKKGFFVYAFAKLSLRSILYYQNHQTQWQLKPTSFYSTIDGSKVGEMSIKLSNRLQLIDKEQHYKIQSSAPMQINNIKTMINYNDDESRMIQRISKFKTNSNSLLLGIGKNQNEVNAERYFQRENDKIILMHRHKKQLESIVQYKNNHKEELMGKLFNNVIDKFYLTQCQVGCPKYVTFHHSNKEKEHKKIYFKIELKAKNADNKPASTSQLSLEQHLSAVILNPQQITFLVEQNLININGQGHYDYELDEVEQSMWAYSGMTHPIVIRVLCFPPKASLLKQSNLNTYFQLKLNLYDQYNQQIQSFHTKIKLKQPSIENIIYVHGYNQDESEIEIPIDEEYSKETKSNVLSNLPDLQFKWSMNSLKLKLFHQGTGQRSYYLIITDHSNLCQIACCQITIISYPKLSQKLVLALGQVKKINLDFSLDQQVLTEKMKEIQSQPLHKSKSGKNQVRVLFASSKPQHCIVKCQKQTEKICQLNKSYSLDIKIQSFSNASEKILIHAVDIDENKIIKRWLLEIEKDQQKYKQVYKLSCQHKKPMKYKFQLFNDNNNQNTFRLYSSNLSIMAVPLNAITLIGNQKIQIELQFTVKQEMSIEDIQPISIILTVTNGFEFTNYLFQLNIRVR